jgi:hypothetical protein
MKLRTTPSAMLAIALSSIAPAIAHAQDAGLRDAGPPVDAGGGGTLPMLPSCPGAIDTANVPCQLQPQRPRRFRSRNGHANGRQPQFRR